MRASAKVNQVATPVGSNFGTLINFSLDSLHLERVLFEKLYCFILSQDKALELLLAIDDFYGCFFDIFVVCVCKLVITSICIIEEPIRSWGSMSQVNSILKFHSFAQDVSTRVPENFPPFIVLECKKLDLAVSLERPGRVPIQELIVRINFLLLFRHGWSLHPFVCVQNSSLGVSDL